MARATGLAGTKQVKFARTSINDKRRAFGDDITNTERKSSKSSRTLDDLLRAPLPSILAERTYSKMPLKKAMHEIPVPGIGFRSVFIFSHTSSNLDTEDVEIGRADVRRRKISDFIAEESLKFSRCASFLRLLRLTR